jgi:LacI family transcriptional regulator
MKKRTVLLALTDAHHGFFHGAARYAREHHWHLVADMIYTGKIPLGWRGDGILSFTGYRDDLAKFLLSSRVPVVEMGLLRQDLGLPCVAGDNEMIGRLAAEHFLERRFRHFAWAPFMDDTINSERHRGFTRRLARERLRCHVLPAAGSGSGKGGTLNWSSRRTVLSRALQTLPKPLAVFGHNDCVAADIIDVCEEAGVAVPESVAVLGVDNDAILCESLRVPLSSVRHDLEGVAYQAAALLDRLMSGGRAPRQPLRVPPRGLAVRRSTDVVAIENPPVAQALRFIADRYADHLLSVDDVTRASGLSRRPLEILFRQELRRTINEEIIRVRLARATELLRATGQSVQDIAAGVGFTRSNHLCRIFRQRFAMTPTQYRAAESVRPGNPSLLGKNLL